MARRALRKRIGCVKYERNFIFIFNFQVTQHHVTNGIKISSHKLATRDSRVKINLDLVLDLVVCVNVDR